MSDAKTRIGSSNISPLYLTRPVDSSEGYRDRESLKKSTPNKIETSNPVFVPRGRFMHTGGENEHPRHLSLQNDYASYKPVSLNTSLRSTVIFLSKISPFIPFSRKQQHMSQEY